MHLSNDDHLGKKYTLSGNLKVAKRRRWENRGISCAKGKLCRRVYWHVMNILVKPMNKW